jgi:hypothetical protein
VASVLSVWLGHFLLVVVRHKAKHHGDVVVLEFVFLECGTMMISSKIRLIMLLFLGALGALGGCQSTNVANVAGSAAGNADTKAVNVIEWETTSVAFVSPPEAIKESINQRCQALGHETGVITSMHLTDNLVSAEFDCRGDIVNQ